MGIELKIVFLDMTPVTSYKTTRRHIPLSTGLKAVIISVFFFLWRCDPTRVMVSFLMFLDHTQRRTTVGRTPLDE